MFSFPSRQLHRTTVSFDLKLNYSLKKRVLYRKEITTNQPKAQKQKHTDSGLQLLMRTQTCFFFQTMSSGLMKHNFLAIMTIVKFGEWEL